ncbi:MAG: hypothetical protein MJ002_03500 [Paludibacteraceae bacterium]|nr:hypothetical protein [Paludibacteraceae bacterium]
MNNLFTENDYLDYKFPEPQYLGAKYMHWDLPPWFANTISIISIISIKKLGVFFGEMGKTITRDTHYSENQIYIYL